VIFRQTDVIDAKQSNMIVVPEKILTILATSDSKLIRPTISLDKPKVKVKPKNMPPQTKKAMNCFIFFALFFDSSEVRRVTISAVPGLYISCLA